MGGRAAALVMGRFPRSVDSGPRRKIVSKLKTVLSRVVKNVGIRIHNRVFNIVEFNPCRQAVAIVHAAICCGFLELGIG